VLRKIVGVFTLSLLALVAYGQQKGTVRVELGVGGEREVWVQDPTTLDTPPTSVTSVKEDTSGKISQATVDYTGDPAKLSVFVWDKQSGNVAERNVKAIPTGQPWKVTASDYKRIRSLSVKVEHEGLAVSAANVKLTSGKDQRSTLIAPGDKGLAKFSNVTAGSIKIVVEYKSEETSKTSTPQSFDVMISRDQAEPSLVVSIPDKVETIAPEKPAEEKGALKGEKGEKSDKEEGKEKEKEAPKTNPLGSLISMLLTLAVLAGVAYGIYRYVKKNPDQVQNVLKQVGPQVVDPGAPGASAPPMPVQPEPIQKIVLGDTPVVPIAMQPVAPPMAGPAVMNPRLVKEDGSVFLIPTGETVVGREAFAGLPLVAESSVSRQHASLTRSGDDVFVKDLGSTNGTYVNSVKVSMDVQLRQGDAVQFGSIKYRFEV